MLFFLNSIHWWRMFILSGLVWMLFGCGDNAVQQFSFTGPTMGTTYSIKGLGANVDATELQSQVDNRLVELNMIFSTYVADSEISKINANSNEEQRISKNMEEVLVISQEIYEISSGAFDVTVDPLVNLWGFGSDGPVDGVPDDNVIEDVMNQIGFHQLVIENGQLRRPPSVSIDLSAVAKGYAVDEIAALLESSGLENYLVEIGGEVKTSGKNSLASDWVIGIEAPDREVRSLYRTLPVFDLALATSGDYRNFFDYQGVIYSHTIDPRTGWPVEHNLVSVTVLHESAAMADALATAFIVLGAEETMRIAEEENFLVFAILREKDNFEERLSEALVNYLDRR